MTQRSHIRRSVEQLLAAEADAVFEQPPLRQLSQEEGISEAALHDGRAEARARDQLFGRC